jgi:hypothetical protein
MRRIASESWALKQKRQRQRRAEYLRAAGRDVTPVHQTFAGRAEARGDVGERARRFEELARGVRRALKAA